MSGRYKSSNNDPRTNNHEFIADVAVEVSKRLGRKTIYTENEYILNVIAKLDPATLKRYKGDIGKLKSDVSSWIVNDIKGFYEKRNTPPVDTHELLVDEMNSQSRDEVQYNWNTKSVAQPVSSFVGSASVDGGQQQSMLPASPTEKHQYIVADSKYRYETAGQITKFSWSISYNQNSGNGSINSLSSMRYITYIRVFPIRIPYVDDADTAIKRITLNIEELSPQAFIAHEGRRFQFIFDSKVDGRYIDLNPFNFNDGYFRFEKLITKLDGITATFGNPLQTITFDADRSPISAVTYGILTTLITTSINHNLHTGDRVIFSGFTTASPVADSTIISTVNRTSGFFATFVNNTSFTISLDTSTLAAPVTDSMLAFFDSKRVIIGMEVGYLVSEK